MTPHPHRTVRPAGAAAGRRAGAEVIAGRRPGTAGPVADGWAEVPDTFAVVDGGVRLGADELRRRAARVTRAVRASTEDGGLVAVALPSGADLVVTVLGCLAAGVPFLALDPATPPARLRRLLADTRPDLLVTDRPAAPAGPAWRPDPAPLPGTGASVLRAAPEPDRASTASWAYLAATSGSSGRPKVCVIGRSSVDLHCRRIVDRFGLGPGDTVLQCSVPGFDVWQEEVLPAAVAGATVVCLPRGPRMAPAGFAELVDRSGATVVNVPVGFWSLWLDWMTATGARPPDRLRLVVVGSEPVPAATAARWSGPVLLSAYGLSEATVTSFVHDVTADGLPDGAATVPLGRPLPGTAYELGPAGPDGARELVLTGADVQLGYLRPGAGRQLDATAGRLATGDLVRADGDLLVFATRKDDLVKVRGVRVSPRETEAALRRQPEVRDAAVVPGPGAQDGLRAYVVGDTAVPAELLTRLAAELPAAAVPQHVTVLPALPRTPTGKLDRAALTAPAPATGSAADTSVPGLMADVLGRDLGPDDDFFGLGGHSLLAMALLGRIEQHHGVRLGMADLVAARTPREVEQLLATGGRAPLPGLPRAAVGERFPLTSQQSTVWFHQALDPDSRAYHCQSSVDLTGPLDADRLAAALRAVVDAHPVYRTTFGSRLGEPYQEIHPAAPLVLERARATAGGPVAELVAAFIDRPFDLTAAPLLRALLIERAPERHTLVVVEHHLVHDGFSFALLLREVIDRYAGRAVPAPDPAGYGRYARWQQEQLAGPLGAGLARFWADRLAGSRDLELLSGPGSGRAVARRIRVEQAAVDRARQGARAGLGSLFQLATAALSLTLAAASGQRDFCLGIGVANRRVPGTAAMLGMFVTVLPLRVTVDGDERLLDWTRRWVAHTVEALDHQELPTAEIVRRLAPPRRDGVPPLFQAMVGFDDGPVPDVRLGDAVGRLTELTNGSPKLPLNLIVVPQQEQRAGTAAAADPGVTVIWESDPALLAAGELDLLARGFDRALTAVSTAGPGRVGDLLARLPRLRRPLGGGTG